ncbi:MAG: hypothetical protein JWM80_2242 [Cyanobacteria bacterium RYN_339]|nr:hypothetical protein [Cyanobacteria bacterium RYN_339]
MKRFLPVLAVILAGCGHPLTTAPVAHAPLALSAKAKVDTPLAVVKIQSLASQGLEAANAQATWELRYAASNHALLDIDAVQLDDHALNNLPAKIGVLAANGYGYMGFHPTDENKFKIQAVALQFLKANQSESALSKGGAIFTMGAQMVAATTGFDQGCRVGISVLAGLRDNYKDAEVSKKAGDLLKLALKSQDKPTTYQVILDGLKQLGQSIK